jgi:ATP-dependent helicase HrpA
VAGATGCGKTTQLPQMLARAALTDRMIAVTQPRRLAAVSVAWRIADEQGVPCGDEVGYCIRFDDCSGAKTRIRIMTDGILLQEARTDPQWQRYGVIVIDEAHERSLNIDFALGLLKDVLRVRPDLRVVVSSATMDPQVFVSFFRDVAPVVPVVEIDARPHPVEVQWRPLADGSQEAMVDTIVREVRSIRRQNLPGHVLVFLPGEDAIKKTAAALGGSGAGEDCAILPLYGALQREDQERVFADLGRRKVILATNIAETSITVDDVRHVIDSGLAKVPRVNPRTGVMVLREEGISQASADQRMGRAGRTAAGRCVRLYAAADYRQRPPFTDPEIVRLDLAETVLSLVDLGVRDVEGFDLPTRPPRGRLMAAVEQLQFLGAIDRQRHLTPMGQRMVRFPLSPQLARMVLEAVERFGDVVDDVLALAAWLSTRSPQVYPAGHEDAARRSHDRWADPLGDAATSVRIYRAYQRAPDRERFCAQHFMDPATLAFVERAHRQLSAIVEEMGVVVRGGGDLQGLVRAVAAGHAHLVLIQRGKWYEAASEDRVFLHPSSALYGHMPRFVVATEVVVSQRAYARQVSLLKGAWVAELRPDLAERWQLRVDHLRRAEGLPPLTQAGELRLGGVVLAVETGKGKPRVEVPAEAIAALAQVHPSELPPGAARWQARLRVGPWLFLQGTPLAALLAQLAHLPLPKAGEDLRCRVPEGTLLEAERNRHLLLRHLPDLLAPMLPHTGKRAGWVGLVCNGEDGFWYEVMADYREAVEITAASLELLEGLLEGDDEAVLAVREQRQRTDDKAAQLRQAMQEARTARRA